MKEKCAICGEIADEVYTFTYHDFTWGYKLRFCFECGEKVRDFIKEIAKK